MKKLGVKNSIVVKTSLVASQWLRLHAHNAGSPGSILGQGTKSPHATTEKKKTPHATTKGPTCCPKAWLSQINLKKQTNSILAYTSHLEVDV